MQGPRLTRFPQGPFQIDRSNPLTRGLIFFAPMIGGQPVRNLVNGVLGTPSAAISSKAMRLGVFPDLQGQYIDFPAFGAELTDTMPATVAWVQQPRGPSAYNTLMQFKPSGAIGPFLIYQSTSDFNYYFAAGMRGDNNVANFGASTGPLVDGQVDSFVLTANVGFGNNNPGNLALFRGRSKFTTAAVTSLSASSNTLLQIGHLGAGGDPWHGTVGWVAIWNRVLSDAEAIAYNSNPSQLALAPQRRQYFDAPAGGANTYSYTAAGGFVLSGVATKVRGAARTASGGITTGGAAGAARGVVRSTSGGIIFAGAASQAKGRSISAAGGLTLGGTAAILRGVARSASGGVLFAGHANVSFFSAVQSLVVTPAGGIVFAGAGLVARGMRKVASGGLSLAGRAGTTFFPPVVVVYLNGILPEFVRRRRRK